jgi:hypothetical protein
MELLKVCDMPARFKKVIKDIYRGGAPSAKDLIAMSKKINRIISLDRNIASLIAPIVNKLGMEHVVIPLSGGETNNTYFTDFLNKNIVSLLLDNTPTYIHCLHGSDRAGLAVALFRVKYSDWKPEDAIREALGFQFGDKIKEDTESFYCDLIQNAHKSDVNEVQDIDVGFQLYDMFGLESVPPFYSPRQSWAPYTDFYHQTPYYPVDEKGRDRKHKELKYRKEILRQILKSYQSEGDTVHTVPAVGGYDNYSGVRGVGPVETGGWVQF